MARLYLFAEGPTEQTFADTVLKPHLAKSGVYLHGPVLIAHARKKGRIHRGGGRKYAPMKNDILRLTAQEKGSDVFFTTMIDLYAIYRDFPGMSDADKVRHLPYKRVELLEKVWRQDIEDERFIPFIQLHEFEAYLFANPEAFAHFYDDAKKPIAKLQEIVGKRENPELIDDGQNTAPSKRIIEHFPDYAKAKPTVGPQVGALIGVDVIRSRCPHFDLWLKTLEGLGRGGAK